MVEMAIFVGFPSQPDVLCYGTFGHRAQLLMDHGDTIVQRLIWRLEIDFLSLELNAP